MLCVKDAPSVLTAVLLLMAPEYLFFLLAIDVDSKYLMISREMRAYACDLDEFFKSLHQPLCDHVNGTFLDIYIYIYTYYIVFQIIFHNSKIPYNIHVSTLVVIAL